MNFKKWVNSIQTVGYNGKRTVHIVSSVSARKLKRSSLAWLRSEPFQLDLAQHGKFQLELITSTFVLYGSMGCQVFNILWTDMSQCQWPTEFVDVFSFKPKRCGLLGGVLFGKMKFVLSNFLSSEDLSISYKSWDVQLTFDTLINAFRFKA